MEISSLYYTGITIPAFFIILICMASIEYIKINKVIASRLIQYFSKSSYAFFLAQFFTWNTTKIINSKLSKEAGNLQMIFISFGICMGVTFIFHIVIERNIQEWLLKMKR